MITRINNSGGSSSKLNAFVKPACEIFQLRRAKAYIYPLFPPSLQQAVVVWLCTHTCFMLFRHVWLIPPVKKLQLAEAFAKGVETWDEL